MSLVLEFVAEASAELECVTGDYEAKVPGLGKWPNALQRTAQCVTAPASATAFPPTVQVPRRTPQSLSLGPLGLMITRISFALLLLLCAKPVLATDNYSYKADEYATISGGRSPDGRWSIATHGEGEAGYGKFDFYLMREPAHGAPVPLRMGDSLDTAPLSLIAVWAPDSKHVALLHRIDRHVLDVELFALSDRKAQRVTVPLLLDVVGKRHLKKGAHYELFSRLFRVTWQRADRFVLDETDALDAHEPVFGAGLKPYVTVDRLGSERTFTYFSAQAVCEINAKGELRLVDVKALPQSRWSKPIHYSPHLIFDTERGLHSTETTISSLDAQKNSH